MKHCLRSAGMGLLGALLAAALAQAQFIGSGGSGNATSLQGVAVAATAPSSGNCLVYGGGAWSPSACGEGQLPAVFPESYGAKGDGNYYFDGAVTQANPRGAVSGNSGTPATPVIVTGNNSVVDFIYLTRLAWTSPPSTGTSRIAQPYASGEYSLTVNDESAATAGSVGSVPGTTNGYQNWAAAAISLSPAGGTIALAGPPQEVQQGGGDATLTLNLPAGAAPGDLVLACNLAYTEGNTIAWPSSLAWTQAAYDDLSGDTLDCRTATLGATMPASLVWTESGSANSWSGGILVYAHAALGAGNSLLTSATAGFAANDVGDPICTAATSSSGGQQCGTIQSYVSPTEVQLSYGAGTAKTDDWFGFGSDDTQAFRSMLASAPCDTTGCAVELQPHGYALTGGLTIPPNVLVSIHGAGAVQPNEQGQMNSPNGLINVNAGTRLMFLTQSMTSAGLTLGGSTAMTNTAASPAIRDLTLWGGAGHARDGAGADCIDVVNWQMAQFDWVTCGDFAGNGFLIDSQGNPTVAWTDGIDLSHAFSIWNGSSGIQFGSTTEGGPISTLSVTGSFVESNGGPAVKIARSVYGLLLTTDVFQWDNTTAAGPEVVINDTPIGQISDDYFEVNATSGSKSTAAMSSWAAAGMVVGPNYITGTGSGETGWVGIGTTVLTGPFTNACSGSATLAAGTATVSNNCLQAGTAVSLNYSTLGGTPGYLTYSVSNGSLAITSMTGGGSTNTADTGTVTWAQN